MPILTHKLPESKFHENLHQVFDNSVRIAYNSLCNLWSYMSIVRETDYGG